MRARKSPTIPGISGEFHPHRTPPRQIIPNLGIEILLHDLSNPSRSLVALENNVTGRNLHDGTTNLVIDLKKRQISHEEKLNYELNLGARKFKCTTIPIIRKEYGVVGAICVNVDANYLTEESLAAPKK